MCDSERVSTSCFLCRQVINELFNPDSPIICYNNKYSRWHMKDIHSFIILAYNESDDLEECIKSIKKQSMFLIKSKAK